MDAKTNNPPVLEVRGLTKRFGGLTAVKNLNLDLRAGEIFGLIGPNGSGKSTAMKAIMGIERPSGGLARAQDRAQGFRHGVPALAAAEPPDRA
jgi:branched-chain amino acid transport system ATP-binding protein